MSQSILYGLVQQWGKEGFNQNILKMQEHYRLQSTAAIDALCTHFTPAEVQFVRPDCGMFIWLNFPELSQSPRSVPSFELFKSLAEDGIICVPGDDFYVPDVDEDMEGKRLPTTLRITFAASSPAKIQQGIAKMADRVKKMIAASK